MGRGGGGEGGGCPSVCPIPAVILGTLGWLLTPPNTIPTADSEPPPLHPKAMLNTLGSPTPREAGWGRCAVAMGTARLPSPWRWGWVPWQPLPPPPTPPHNAMWLGDPRMVEWTHSPLGWGTKGMLSTHRSLYPGWGPSPYSDSPPPWHTPCCCLPPGHAALPALA